MKTRIVAVVLAGCLLAACAGRKEIVEDDPDELRASAELAVQQGKCTAALDDYRKLLRLVPDDIAALLAVGECRLALGDAARALAAFEEVLRREPESIDAQEGRALARLGLGRHAEAGAGFNGVLTREPARWRSLNGLGLLADLANDRDAAKKWYEKAIDLNPDEATLWNNYGWSRVMAQDYVEAERLLDEAYARKPTSRRIAGNLSVAIAWRGDYERALRIAMRLSEEHVAYNDIGYIAMLRGDNETAISFFQKAIDKAPSWFERAATNLERARKAEKEAAAAP